MTKKVMNRTLLVLVCAQFIITLDTTFMNVSLSALVADLHTTVTGVQGAIALYAMVMAALMIAGAKFGDIIGRKKAFILGVIVYACGTTIASLSPSLLIFIGGWSVCEGVGAAIMLPTMMSLIAANFAAGPTRAKAYAIFAGSAGVAAALGPIIGGLFTTYLSWRLAFASELLVAFYILSQRNILKEQPLEGPKITFDWAGFSLSSLGLTTVVLGIIFASSYGFVKARSDVVFFGRTLLEAGKISPTIILALLGMVVLVAFAWMEAKRMRQHKDTLLNIALLKVRTIRAGSVVLMMQMLLLTGIIFALSLYVQMELRYSAILSGLTLLPLSFGVLFFSVFAGRILARHMSPKRIMRAGFIVILLGVVTMGIVARNATAGWDFFLGLLMVGAGVGFVSSQAQNLMISAVSARYTNETAGIINTFQNIGSSLGTSIAGAVIIALFISVATSQVSASSSFSSSEKANLQQAFTEKAQIVSDAQLSTAIAHLPSTQQREILAINQQARQRSLTVVYYTLGLVGIVGFLATVRLPAVTRPQANL